MSDPFAPSEDQNKGPTIIKFSAALVCLPFIFVCMRIYVRITIVPRLGWDDFFHYAKYSQ